MTRAKRPGPYEILHEPGGPWVVHEPVTGIRVEHARLRIALPQMHRLLIARRDELLARDPAGFDDRERAELERLSGWSDRFLYDLMGLQRAA